MQENGMVDFLVRMQESLSLYVYKYIYLFIYFIYLLESVKEKVQLQEKHHFVTVVGKFLWLSTIKRTE